MAYFFEPVNLNQWNMFEKVKRIGHVEPFLATSKMKVGDIVLLHVGRQNPAWESGIYAYGIIIHGPYILRDSPDDYCNNKNTVDVRIVRLELTPFFTHEECKSFINQFRTVHEIDGKHSSLIETRL